MPLVYKETSQPAAEPVELELAKNQCNIDTANTTDDGYLTGLIIAARQYVEQMTNRAIFNRNVSLFLDFFPFPSYGGTINPNDRHVLYGEFWHQLAIRLPKPGCVSVTTIKYKDLAGNPQTLDDSQYYVDVNSEPARIVPQPGVYWPYTQSYLPSSVEIDYVAGTYGDGIESNTCPMTIVQAMLLLISHWYSNRDAAMTNPPKEIDLGVKALLAGEMFDTFGF